MSNRRLCLIHKKLTIKLKLSPISGGQPPFLCAVVYTILGLLQASGAWVLYSLGINIVAAFIYAGSMFPLVAVRIAYGWSSAFADMAGALLEGFSGHFGRVHSAGIEGLRGVGENIQGRVGGVIRALAGKDGQGPPWP